jgi:cyclopropane fatty-acyl-phospholipid synthase-like methyltransferase
MIHAVPDNWYESFFSGINCEMWERALPDEFNSAEAGFLVDTMEIGNRSEILDIPCGFGRLAIPLAKRGFNLTCVDISERFMMALDKKVKEENLSIRTIYGNILSIDLAGSYDGAICMGNSFGYFDYKGMEIFVKKLSSCLRPHARFIINSGMVAESILPKIPAEMNYVLGDLSMQISNEYVAEESYMVSHLTYKKGNHSEQHSFKHYVYTIGEIKRLLRTCDLKIIKLYSGLDKTDYKLGDPQVYIVCEKMV